MPKISKIKAIIFTFIPLIVLLAFLELFSFAAVKAYNKFKGTNYSPTIPQAAFVWWDYSPVLGIKPLPDIRACKLSDTTGHRIGTDRYGFAYNDDPKRVLMPKPANTYRIFMLGGSTVWGSGISENNKTIAAQMEAILNNNSKYPFRFEVVNAGVRGYISYEEFSYLTLNILYYQPDMIVVLDGINDFYYPNHDPSILPNMAEYQMTQLSIWNNKGGKAAMTHLKGFFSSICPAGVNAWKDIYSTVRYRSYFIYLTEKLLEKAKSGIKFKSKNKSAPKTIATSASTIDINPVSYNCYIQNLKNMAGVCQANDLKLVLLFQPTLGSGHKDYLTSREIFLLNTMDQGYEIPNAKDILPRYYDIVSGEFEKLKQRYANDNTRIENLESVFKDVKDTIYADEIHYNDLGAKILAERISSIVTGGFIDKKNE